jgi:hypothetical protein
VNRRFADAFRKGLKDLGYVEGQNIVIEPPSASRSSNAWAMPPR